MKIIQIIEANKVGQYYNDNPDKKLKTDINPPAAKKDNYHYQPENPMSDDIRQFERKFADKWKPVFGDQVDKVFKNNSLDWSAKAALGDSRSFETFVDYCELELDEKSEARLRSVYPKLVKDALTLQKKTEVNVPVAKSNKQATERGVNARDYRAAMAWAKHYMSMSGKAIPKEVWPVLHKITVNPPDLPEVVYRGLFFDGAKIKDLETWQKKWHPGSKPGLKPRKATSWSTSIGLATQFMNSQDMIKDNENGFAILLKYEINSLDDVVADFRNLPDNTFWNQQEILLSTEAKNYEVVAVIPYQEYSAADNKLKAFQKKHSAPNASAMGSSKPELLVQNFFKINQMQVSPRLKEQWRSFATATVAQVKKVIPVNNYSTEYENRLLSVKFPLYCLLAGNSKFGTKRWNINIDDAVDTNTVGVILSASLNSDDFNKPSKVTKKIVGDLKAGSSETITTNANLTLVNDAYNNLVFNLTLDNEFTVKPYSRYSRPEPLSDGAVAVQSALSNPKVIMQLQQEIEADIVKIYGNVSNKNVTLNVTSA